MMLELFFDLMPQEQEVFLHYESFDVRGTCESLACMLGEDIYKAPVINIAAEGDTLVVWAKEAVGSGNT